jgi:hypothetical protein
LKVEASGGELFVREKQPEKKRSVVSAKALENVIIEFLAFLRTQLPDPATGKPAPYAVPRSLDSHPAAYAHGYVVVVKGASHSSTNRVPKK